QQQKNASSAQNKRTGSLCIIPSAPFPNGQILTAYYTTQRVATQEKGTRFTSFSVLEILMEAIALCHLQP
ncbi:MAG: hypothetical protein J6A48_04680, partial [Clostridia bacterium]|nr:hypothetical protein [Clostridia bacterium]